MLCELDLRKAVNKSSSGVWRCVTIGQTDCECWNAIAVCSCACELPGYLMKCSFWCRRSGMDSEASVFKLSGFWCFWTVDHAQSSRGFFFFFPSVSGVSLMGLSGSRRIWLAFCRKAECGLVEEKGWRDKLISLCRLKRPQSTSICRGQRPACGITLVDPSVFCTWENISVNRRSFSIFVKFYLVLCLTFLV